MGYRRLSPQTTYHVAVTRQDDSHALAETREHAITLNVKRGAGEAGFNAAETLLAALGTCLMTNVNAIGAKMRLDIRSARIEIDAVRQDEPPKLTDISYRLILDSSEPLDQLRELQEMCMKWGTVTNTLISGIVPHGELVIQTQQKNEEL